MHSELSIMNMGDNSLVVPWKADLGKVDAVFLLLSQVYDKMNDGRLGCIIPSSLGTVGKGKEGSLL